MAIKTGKLRKICHLGGEARDAMTRKSSRRIALRKIGAKYQEQLEVSVLKPEK
jgi:hypothetical protein